MFYRDPDKLYIHCDGSMDYDSKSTGGIGIEIVFPYFTGLQNIEESLGRFEGANIERLELQAILKGLYKLGSLYDKYPNELKNVKNVVITTDRFGLNDKDRTSPYRIRDWRKNKWRNYEGKPIKNSDILEKIDKTRTKLISKCQLFIEINYLRRKFNKIPDKLAKAGKTKSIVDRSVAKSIGVYRRKFDGAEVLYARLKEKEVHSVHVFSRQIVGDEWEIYAEFCEGEFKGEKIKIYIDRNLKRKIHRAHIYRIKIKKVFGHHIKIFKTVT